MLIIRGPGFGALVSRLKSGITSICLRPGIRWTKYLVKDPQMILIRIPHLRVIVQLVLCEFKLKFEETWI